MLTDLDYELLSAYIDGALTDSERAAFELRLQAEPELSRELDELRATVTLLNNLPPRKAPRDFTLDAHYARRSSFFFTSAAFSALSTAAAIVLFALGAYLFTGSGAQAPSASSEQVGQMAFAPSPTASTLDKSSALTATESGALNEITVPSPVENSPSESADLAASSGLAQESATLEPTILADNQSPFLHTDVALATSTSLPDDGIVASAPVVPSSPDTEGRTSEATDTAFATSSNAQDGAAVPGGDTSTGGSVMPSLIQPPAQAQTNIEPYLAATQLPFTATAAPSATVLLRATLVPTSTDTATPLPTATHTQQPPSPTATMTATVAPPVVEEAPAAIGDLTPFILVGLGSAFLIIAVGTTIVRRRSRQ